VPTRPTVSAIIPVFNGANYVAEAIESVMAQTHPVDEIVVVDDGSTDDSTEVLARFGDRIRVVHQENRGESAARNRGIAAASGEVLAFLDHDDLWTPHKVEVQVAALRADPAPVAVFGHVVQFVSPEIEPGRVPVPTDGDRPVPGTINGTLVTFRTTFELTGPFPERRDGTAFVDWYARILDADLGVVTVPEVVLRRRHHLGNLGRTHASAPETYARAMRRVIDRRRGRLPDAPAR